VVTLVAVVAVLFVHAYNMSSRFGSGENTADPTHTPGLAGFVEYLVSQTLCRWPAATLFAISGFLFFHSAVAVGAAVLLRRYAPRPYAWLTGGR
jgi:hypothetical protein